MDARYFIVFTDIHMTVEPRAGCPDPEARLRAGLDHAFSVKPDAELLLLCGDLTHHGDEASYRRLKSVLDDVPIPVVPMLGNHDDRAAFRRVFPDAPADEDGFVQNVTDFGDARLIALDTLIVRKPGDDFTHAGELCARRLDWLDRQLSAAGDVPCIIAMHHPPHDTGFQGMDIIKLRDGEVFHDLIARHGNVSHVIAGHIHRTISGTYRRTPFSIFKSPMVQMPLVFDGTDSSLECDEPPAFGLVFVKGDTVLVHTEDFAAP